MDPDRSVYEMLLGDEDARVCKDVPDAACKHLPRNFLIHVIALAATKTGDHLGSAKLVLVWVLGAVGAPAFMAGLTVPIRESLALIPQLFVAAWIRSHAIRKWFWVGGSAVQGACMAGMGMVALGLEGLAAGWSLLGLLVLFSLARGVCSVAIKDVQGKTVSRRTRGKASGYASSAAGGAALIIGATGLLSGGERLGYLASLLFGAAGLWLGAAVVYSWVVEERGQTSGGGNAGQEALRQLGLMRSDPQFRHFVLTRALFLSTAFAAPFMVVTARESGGTNFSALGGLLLAVGAANLLGGPVWGHQADISSRRVLIRAGWIAGAACGGLFAAVQLGWQHAAMFAGFYFVLALAHSGVRLGRSTYLIDMATQETRAAYTAVSNTLIGLLLLGGGSLSLLEPWLGASGMVLLFGGGSIVAAIVAMQLPEIDD
ncbi:MAG: MFS transporter [Abyssibacter sp.]|uniref:MFS transporter n=1 Tax=Abyssibacter sp. TaxID=2320200 RepID=UPI00321BBAC3